MLQRANVEYQKGVQSTSYQERSDAFNQALFLYQSIDQAQENYSFGMDLALGDTYFQLGDYAWAILYYQRALYKNQHDVNVISHLALAQHKIGLPENISEETQRKNHSISFLRELSDNSSILLWAIFVVFLINSSAIWVSLQWVRMCAAFSLFILLLLIGNYLFFYYTTPLEGVLVKTTGLYRSPDWSQPQITEQPLLAGSKVRILQMVSDKRWVKLKDSEGMIGYVPTENVRSIK